MVDLIKISGSLAMAEMTTLLAAIYKRYSTSEYKRQRGSGPVITSRFEVFYDETLPKAEVSTQFGLNMDLSRTNSLSHPRNINVSSNLRKKAAHEIYYWFFDLH